MADQTPPVVHELGSYATGIGQSIKTWPEIADTAMHYAAGGALLALCAYLSLHQALSQDLMATMIAGAAVGIGFKLKGQ